MTDEAEWLKQVERGLVKAANALSTDPSAKIECPVCHVEKLQCLNVPFDDGAGRELYISCPRCGRLTEVLIRGD